MESHQQTISIEKQKEELSVIIADLIAESIKIEIITEGETKPIYPENSQRGKAIKTLIDHLKPLLNKNENVLTEALKIIDTHLKDQMTLLEVNMKYSNGLWKPNAWEDVGKKFKELDEKQLELKGQLLAIQKHRQDSLMPEHEAKNKLDGALKRIENSKYPRYLLSLSTKLSGLTKQTTLERQHAERNAQTIMNEPKRAEETKQANMVEDQPPAKQKSSSSGFTFFNKAFQAARQKTRHVLDKAEEKIDKIKTSIKRNK